MHLFDQMKAGQVSEHFLILCKPESKNSAGDGRSDAHFCSAKKNYATEKKAANNLEIKIQKTCFQGWQRFYGGGLSGWLGRLVTEKPWV